MPANESILAALHELALEANSVPHPYSNQEKIIRLGFLFGACIFASIDGPPKCAALQQLDRYAFELALTSEELAKTLTAAEKADSAVIKGCIIDVIKESAHKILFMLDIHRITSIDSILSKEKKDAIIKFYEILHIPNHTRQFISELVKCTNSEDVIQTFSHSSSVPQYHIPIELSWLTYLFQDDSISKKIICLKLLNHLNLRMQAHC